MWEKRSIVLRYTLYGTLFGLAFPVLSTCGDLYIQQLPLNLDSLLQIQKSTPLHWVIDTAPFFLGLFANSIGKRQDQLLCLNKELERGIQERDQAINQLEVLQVSLEQQVVERTAELEQAVVERGCMQEESAHLQQEIIEAQRRAIEELSAPVIPVMEHIIVMPLVGSIDNMRARDITRALLEGIRQQRAKVVILDITGVHLVDSNVASHLNRTIRTARLKGARTIITGISDAVAEMIVDLGIDWGEIGTQPDLQTGLIVALKGLGITLTQ
ncbi:MAG: STAS domain-containing protein [Chloroflexi bacterium]|nr:STAS domain-containing protein [Chloroflexota bacterium]